MSASAQKPEYFCSRPSLLFIIRRRCQDSEVQVVGSHQREGQSRGRDQQLSCEQPDQPRQSRIDGAHPAKTPPARTRATLRPNFHQNLGESGGSSGSIGLSFAICIAHSAPRLRCCFDTADEENDLGITLSIFERDSSVGREDDSVRRGRRGGIALGLFHAVSLEVGGEEGDN